MKKFFTFILMAAALVACTEIEQPELVENPDAPKTYTMIVKASKTVDTKALALSGSTLTAKWAENEEVKVYEGSTLLGSLYAQELTNNGASCSLRGTLDNAPSASGVTLTLKFNTASYGGQDGTLDYIANHCDYAEATTTVTIDGSTITGTTAAFTNKQAIVKFTLVDRADATGTLSPSVLNATVSYMGVLLRNYSFNVPGTTYTTNGAGIIFLAIPSDIPSSVQIGGNTINTDPANISFTLSATVGSETYNYSRTGFPFENGKYYEITVKMKNDKVGKVLGKNGQIYANKSAAESAGTTAVAMIAYVGSNTGESSYTHGLALALTDVREGWGPIGYQYKTSNTSTNHTYKTTSTPFSSESGKQYSSHNFSDYPAFGAAFEYTGDLPTISNSGWFLGTGYQWQQMIASMGSDDNAIRFAFEGIGGENMDSAGYWLSTDCNTEKAWYLPYSSETNFSKNDKTNKCYVRPILAF